MASARIEDYALVGDLRAAGLVGKDGSIDWLALPRFGSGACFAKLLGESRHGRWLLAPAAGTVRETRRRYRGDSLVLETTFRTASGAARRTATISARIDSAISGAVTASMFRPTGAWIRAIADSEWPSSVSRATRFAWVRRLPSAPM
jgi:GH15 family glucan-1,4-alpha-glucosidase